MAKSSKRFTVLGVEHKTGTFEGKAYDTFTLHCSQPLTGTDCEGVRVVSFKLRSADFDDCTEDCSILSSPDDLFGLIGSSIKIYADKYFYIEEFRV